MVPGVCRGRVAGWPGGRVAGRPGRRAGGPARGRAGRVATAARVGMPGRVGSRAAGQGREPGGSNPRWRCGAVGARRIWPDDRAQVRVEPESGVRKPGLTRGRGGSGGRRASVACVVRRRIDSTPPNRSAIECSSACALTLQIGRQTMAGLRRLPGAARPGGRRPAGAAGRQRPAATGRREAGRPAASGRRGPPAAGGYRAPRGRAAAAGNSNTTRAPARAGAAAIVPP